MATYAIGDVQGCYDELQDLLRCILFDPEKDTLWFAGDLVNRGPKSLEVLRFIKNLPRSVVVLGNHDIHLLSLANRLAEAPKNHGLNEVLKAPDCDSLIDWLRHQPLFHYDSTLGFAMVHAGIPPQWDLSLALDCAQEAQRMLQSDQYPEFLKHLYGNQPIRWHAQLAGWSRLRFIVNALTRMRFCDATGKLDFSTKGGIGTQPPGYFAWFEVPGRLLSGVPIVFGHWAALEGKTGVAPQVFALDTGCVWGNYLTAMRLEDKCFFQTPARKT